MSSKFLYLSSARLKIQIALIFNWPLRISNWAIRFGAQMWEIGKQVTRIREIKEVGRLFYESVYNVFGKEQNKSLIIDHNEFVCFPF